MTETKRLKSFGTIAAMNEEQLDEFFGSIFKSITKAFSPKPKPQPQQNPNYWDIMISLLYRID